MRRSPMTAEELRKLAHEKHEQANKLNEVGQYQSGNGYLWYMSRADALRSEAQALMFRAAKLEEAAGRKAKEEPQSV